MCVNAPPEPNEGRLYNNILTKISAPYSKNDRVGSKGVQVIIILKRISTRLLILDEFHQAADGPSTKQQQFLNAVKGLGNELRISIVAAGTDKAFSLLNSDPQLANRFEPVELPKWRIDDPDYLRLLASFERRIPLRSPSKLTSMRLAQKICSMGEGCIGEIATVIERAAIMAIEGKKECITMEILEAIDWIQPSDRKWRMNKVS